MTEATLGTKLRDRFYPAGHAGAPGHIEELEPRLLLSVATTVLPDFRLYLPSGSGLPAASSGPTGLTPAQIRHAYGMDAITGDGTGQTIALIDAYNDPAFVDSTNPNFSTSDLHLFDVQFGLPDPPSFMMYDQNGGTNFPANDTPSSSGSWAAEEALDIEWAHVMAPGANIVVIEANSGNVDVQSWNYLATAVGTARNLPGVSVVSMSYGFTEAWVHSNVGSGAEVTQNSLYTTPTGHIGVTFLASTGDSGAPGAAPAYSPNVVAVGGTTLSLSGGNYGSETGWSEGGGGQSLYQSEPSYQSSVQSSNVREIPDVSFDADPNSGVPVYDSWDFGASTPWAQFGGTSLSSPCWGGIIAVVDQLRVSAGLTTMDGATQTLPALYKLPASDFHDITSGNNGFQAGVGYDMVTGLGTPIANLLVPDLVGAVKPVVVSSTPSGASTSPVSSVTFTFNETMDTSSFSVAADVDSFTGPGGVNLLSSITGFSWTSSTTLKVSFGATTAQGQYQLTIGPQILSASGEFAMDQNGNKIAGEVPGDEYTASFRYDAIIIAPDSSTPANNAVITAPLTSFTLHFNEAYNPSSIGTGNLTLSQGTVTGFQLVDAQTVQYNLSGVSTEGAFTVNIAAGAITDLYGNPGAAYAGTFTIDLATRAFPTPLAALNPAGGLVYRQSVSDSIVSSTDSDSYTITLDAGQTLTALVQAGAGLQPSVTITGPGGVLGTATGAAAGQNALLQTVPVATTGTYTMTVTGAAGTTGAYTLQATLNAALATQNNGGASDSALATAQNIDGSFISLGGTASRGDVLGTSTGTAGALPSEVEPNNTLAAANDASHNFVSYAGSDYQLGLTGTILGGNDSDWYNIGALQVNEVLTIYEAGSYTSRGTLGDPYINLYRYNNGNPSRVATNQQGGDGTDSLISFTVTVADTYYIRARGSSGSTGTYSLGVLLQTAGTAPLTGGTVTHEGPEPNNTFSTATDASTSWRAIGYQSQTTGTISSSSDVDYYKFQFTAGDLVTIEAKSTSTLATAEYLYNSSGTVVALDDGNSTLNPNSWIFGYIVPTTGVYYVEVAASTFLAAGQTNTGTYTEELVLSTATPPPPPSSGSEWYSFTLAANDVVTLGLANLSAGTTNINMVNSAGAVLASGASSASNLAQIISNFKVATAGTYYVQVSGSTVTPYSVVLTRNAAFVAEPNNSLATAQDISATGTVLGGLTASDGTDFYGISISAGQVWNFQTATPGAAPGQFANTLHPEIELYDPSGTLVASNENGAPDGTNASLAYTALATGQYKVEVLPVGATTGEYVLTASLQLGTVPPAATGLAGTVISSTQVDLAWTDHATNATGYYVQQSPDNATWSTIATLGPTAAGDPVTGLTPGTYYYFRVLAYNTTGASPTPGLKQLAPLPGDIDLDGSVSVGDYNIWAANYGAAGATWAMGDLDGNGQVDVDDYNIWAANYGQTAAGAATPAAASASSTVPATVTQAPAPQSSPAGVAPLLPIDLSPTAPARQSPPVRARQPIIGLAAAPDARFDALAHAAPLRHLHARVDVASGADAVEPDLLASPLIAP